MISNVTIEIRTDNLPSKDRPIVTEALRAAYSGSISEVDFKVAITDPLLRFGTPPGEATSIWGDIFLKRKVMKRRESLMEFLAELYRALKDHHVKVVSFDVIPGPLPAGFQRHVTVA
jgi:hypothetical protein